MNVLRYECKVTEKENSVILSYRAYAEEDKGRSQNRADDRFLYQWNLATRIGRID